MKASAFRLHPPRPGADPSAATDRLEAWLRLEQARRTLEGSPGVIEAVVENSASDTDTAHRFEYRYNASGELVEILEADGSLTRYSYARGDRPAQRPLESVTHPDGTRTFYTYQDDRLAKVDDRGRVTQFTYEAGRLAKIQRPDETVVFRYDGERVTLARTSTVSTAWDYTVSGQFAAIRQSIDGVTLEMELEYDPAGRLAVMRLPGCPQGLHYAWDDEGRPAALSLGAGAQRTELASFTFDDETRLTCTRLANGVETELLASRQDGRPVRFTVGRESDVLFQRAYIYALTGEVLSDGNLMYTYDLHGRLVEAGEASSGKSWRYAYDGLDNRLDSSAGASRYDLSGCRIGRLRPDGEWAYRYDSANRLVEVRCNGDLAARFTYDHKGRLVLYQAAAGVERYFYGPADELLAVTDAAGRPLRLLARTPLGVVAEIHFTQTGADPQIYYRHDDPQGTLRLMTDQAGRLVATTEYSPYGEPETPASSGVFRSVFMGCQWYPQLGLYYFGARWYDPAAGRFLTPDSYSGAPDDERLVNPHVPASRQALARAQILNEWLKQPRLRNRYAFCRNDPVGHRDPSGHWSFGGVLLMLLGAIWTLPNTLFGILVEVTCLVGEVIRWLVWLLSFGNVTWETPGFDAAASGRLNAFALVFTGGWLGSFPNLLGITFGNVFFVYKNWRDTDHIRNFPDPIFPPAYGGPGAPDAVSIPREQALYEHELRHTNQYGWFGPFFHLGLPIFGFYEWDVIVNGYRDAWTERDAREHAEPGP